MDDKKLKDKVKDEILKIKEMEPKKRLTYLKDYYLVKSLVILAFLIMIISMLNEMVFSRKEVVYAGGLMGAYVTEEGKALLTDGFLESLAGNPKKEVVYLYEDLTLNYSSEGAYTDATVDTAVFTMIGAGQFNYFLISDSFMDNYKKMDVFLDISDYAKKYGMDEESILTYNNEVIGIKLSEEICDRFDISSNGESIYIAILMAKGTNENDSAFLDYFFVE